MKLSFSALLLSLVTFATTSALPPIEKRLGCAEASRFGDVTIVPSTLSPGDEYTIHTDFTCSLYFDIKPIYIDYYIEVPTNNNGHEPPILLARRKFHQGFNASPTDTLKGKLPYAFYFANANYAVVLDTTYAVNGTNGKPFLTVGGIETPINITNIVS